jgi:hypothetical protein
MKEPRDFARDVSQFAIPDGRGDRFSGYAVIGLPFSSGHVLALRCFPASSLGAACSSNEKKKSEPNHRMHSASSNGRPNERIAPAPKRKQGTMRRRHGCHRRWRISSYRNSQPADAPRTVVSAAGNGGEWRSRLLGSARATSSSGATRQHEAAELQSLGSRFRRQE